MDEQKRKAAEPVWVVLHDRPHHSARDSVSVLFVGSREEAEALAAEEEAKLSEDTEETVWAVQQGAGPDRS